MMESPVPVEKKHKEERLLNLIAYLLDSGRPRTFTELLGTVYQDSPQETAREIASTRKKFERDKAELRELDIDIEVVRTGAGEEAYRIDRGGYYLPHIELDDRERFTLATALKFFLGPDNPFSNDAHNASLKLTFDGPDERGEEPYLEWVGFPANRGYLATIMDALKKRKTISFSYTSPDSPAAVSREVDPYGVFSRDGNWYMVGNCHLRGGLRTFRLERISDDITVNGGGGAAPDFEIPASFELTNVDRWFWEFSDEERQQVVVRLDPAIAFLRTSSPGALTSEREIGNGVVEVEYSVVDVEQFLRWALSIGPGVTIISPQELRSAVIDRLRAFLGRKDGA